MAVVDISPDVQKIIDSSVNPLKVQETLNLALAEMKTLNKMPDDNQIQILTNHLAEMVERSEKSEKLGQDVDPSIFSAVAPESLAAAKKIVDFIGNVEPDEKYVLSVHFEVANELGGNENG